MPRHLFPRLLVILVAVLAVNTIVTLLLLRVSTFETTALHTARSLETEIVAADALLAATDRSAADAKLAALGIRRSAHAPTLRRAPSGIWRSIEIALGERMRERALYVAPDPQAMLWVAAVREDDGWIGIPLLGLRASLRWTTALGFLAALAVITLGAAWATRALVGPLRLLADAAPRIAAGEPAPPLPPHAAEEIGELATALDRAAAEARAVAREREIMLAGLSHDMRTPLARLGLALELIGGDDDLKRGMAADIGELDAMTGQFVAFVRDGRDEIARDIDLGALLDERLAAQHRAGRVWTRSGARAAHVRAKPLALCRALDNLLENAARHGRAPFEAELEAGAKRARIVVRDRGPGVAASTLADLGRPFFRADAARGGGGSGLGLAIAARFAASQGGKVSFRNRDGGGFEAELVFGG
jgi:two-component system, OmpR family, osmolarity sensor histidine kinase EnvZ